MGVASADRFLIEFNTTIKGFLHFSSRVPCLRRKLWIPAQNMFKHRTFIRGFGLTGVSLCLVGLVRLACLVHLVRLVCLVLLVCLVFDSNESDEEHAHVNIVSEAYHCHW